MKIAFVGAGKVGGALAVGLSARGHEVVLGQGRDGSDSVAATLQRSPRLSAAPLATAVAGAEAVFLATPYGALASLLPPLAPALAGKIVVDCTNPVGPGLRHGLASERSGSEAVQALLPGARVVKCFTVYGFENLEDPAYPGYDVRPAMPLCGDDAQARAAVAGLAAELGFEPVDVGPLVQALHLEHMTLLWVRMVRAMGQAPDFVWAALRRPRPDRA